MTFNLSLDPSVALVIAAVIAAAASIVVARLNSKKLDSIHVLVNSAYTTVKAERDSAQEALRVAREVIRIMKAAGAIDPRELEPLPPPPTIR